jgi:membrane fusion protein (multidrug efflux system)
MLKKLTLTTTIIVAIVGALVGTKLLQFSAMGAAGANMVIPPEIVTAAEVRPDTWENRIVLTGSIAPYQGVTVGAEMAGKVVKIAFESGAPVNAGDLLVQLDIATEEAQLRAAEASAALAQLNLARARELRERNTNSPSDLDAADAQAKQAAAQADAIRAVIAKKTIRAPFAGRLGIRLVNLGQILKDGEPITTLQTPDPVYVNFSVPQQRLSVLAPGTTVRVTTDAAPGDNFTGKINAINPEVDQTTRNVRVQATIPNPAEKLRPGMFANVEVVLPEKVSVLAIPATAVLYAPYGDSVFVIETKNNEKTGQPEQVLRQQFVRLGAARGDFVVVESGLKAGDKVVSSGVFKLRPGMVVAIDNKLAPDAQLAPKQLKDS